METGSSSQPVSGACGSTESLHGLAFGKKIYFEDGGGRGGSSSNSKSSASPEPPAAKKGKTAAQQQQQPPRCQVEGCKVDLTGAKAYYCRHKVCGVHSKSPKVIVAGQEQRFCQQCSRFHQLSEFDQGKRSCRRRLAGHNERRRKPPPVPLPSLYGHPASPLHEDNSRFRSFLMDFSHARSPCTASRNIWPTVRASEQVASNQWTGIFDAHPGGVVGHGAHLCMQGSAGTNLLNAPEIPPPVESFAGVTDSSCALSLLSTQPWGTTIRNQVSTSASFEGAPVAQPVITSDYMADSWGFRCHGASRSAHEVQHAVGLGQVVVADSGQSSGELELALQGSKQCQDVCPCRACSHGRVMHWSP